MPVTKDHTRHLADLMDSVVHAAQTAPWTCTVCDAVQTGPLSEGCSTCGAGTATARKAPLEAPAAPWRSDREVRRVGVPSDIPADLRAYQGVVAWLQANPQGQPVDAYLAGYLQASMDLRAGLLGQTPPSVVGPEMGHPALSIPEMGHPPPASIPEMGHLTPEGKVNRTIRAALALFRDQVLVEGPEEILTGEWCSVSEVDDLITKYTDTRTD